MSRYAAYAKAHWLTPKQMAERDAERYPGGSNTGYILWIHAKWAEYRGDVGLAEDHPLSEADQADFDVWLENHP